MPSNINALQAPPHFQSTKIDISSKNEPMCLKIVKASLAGIIGIIGGIALSLIFGPLVGIVSGSFITALSYLCLASFTNYKKNQSCVQKQASNSNTPLDAHAKEERKIARGAQILPIIVDGEQSIAESEKMLLNAEQNLEKIRVMLENHKKIKFKAGEFMTPTTSRNNQIRIQNPQASNFDVDEVDFRIARMARNASAIAQKASDMSEKTIQALSEHMESTRIYQDDNDEKVGSLSGRVTGVEKEVSQVRKEVSQVRNEEIIQDLTSRLQIAESEIFKLKSINIKSDIQTKVSKKEFISNEAEIRYYIRLADRVAAM